ncbi:hypothetical protein CEXT_289741 [Caerostris extrusa]|uniref:Uncharacterized protein n=1 Tax=Caerostris extrusa TaxID=172846 RepID=A0AAV4VMY2_CAEEX|nr:hypothetical protein CEXT_289741 [Caerostris extrusa]
MTSAIHGFINLINMPNPVCIHFVPRCKKISTEDTFRTHNSRDNSSKENFPRLGPQRHPFSCCSSTCSPLGQNSQWLQRAISINLFAGTPPVLSVTAPPLLPSY